MVFPEQISDEAFGANLKELTKSLGADDLRYLIDTETDAGMKAYFEGLACAGNVHSLNVCNGMMLRGLPSAGSCWDLLLVGLFLCWNVAVLALASF